MENQIIYYEEKEFIDKSTGELVKYRNYYVDVDNGSVSTRVKITISNETYLLLKGLDLVQPLSD